MRSWLLLVVVSGCSFDDSVVLPGFCAKQFQTPVRGARGLFPVEDGVLVVATGVVPAQVQLLVDDDGDGVGDSVFVMCRAPNLTHSVVVHKGFIYASSHSTVLRWRYQPGQRNESLVPEIVISSINFDALQSAAAGHQTRTLAFDSMGRLYISVGSTSNVDSNSYRARIRRFTLPNPLPSRGVPFSKGLVFADGLRNEVGLAFDQHGVLWGVENSADDLNRADLGGDIHAQNPADELNRFPECCLGRNFGYPQCWTQYNLSGHGKEGAIWAWPDFLNSTTDSWCRHNTVHPALPMIAHGAPLGITFFNASAVLAPDCRGSFPAWMHGDAFISYHAVFKVMRVPMTLSGFPRSKPLDFLCHSGTALWPSGFRPVDVKFDRCNRLVISSDGTNGRGGGVFLVTWQCVNCTAGVSRSDCCKFQHDNVRNSFSDPCPGCQTPLPPLPASKPGLWQSSCDCTGKANASGKTKGKKAVSKSSG